MNANPLREPVVLAVAPFVRGVAFIVFSGPWIPVDWGIKWADRDKNARSLEHVRTLMGQYAPDAVVVEDYSGPGSRRSKRIAELISTIDAAVRERKTPTHRYSRRDIRDRFAEFGAVTKQAIAEVIAREYPELAPRLPAKRKIWLPENPNMAIFDAAALAMTFFARAGFRGKRDGTSLWSRLLRLGDERHAM